MRITYVLFVIGLAASSSPQSLEDETVTRLAEYLRIDTINPPGNESNAVDFFAKLLDAEGIHYESAESAPGRGNLWARLEGGDEPALILLNHTDVVPADESYWTMHPLLVKTPIDAFGKVMTTLRAARGTLPPELPVKRTDEIGRLACEVALLAGDLNVSDIRREDGENKISALIGAVAENVFRLDQHGLILAHHSSERARPFTDAESVLGRKIADILPESVTDTCVKALASVVVGGETVALEFSIDLGTATCSYQAHFAPSGQHEVLLTVRDMTEQKEKDSSKARLDAILNATLDPVVTVTQEGEISYLNPVGFQLLGLEAPLEAGLKIVDFLPEWARDQVQKTAIPTAIEEGKWQGESALLAPGDTEIPVSMTAVSHPTDSSEVELVSLIARDQSERKRFDDHLLFLADHDPLTSLYTRRRFLEELGREIARAQRSGSGGAVIVLDLDDLRYVNDSVGHSTGDKLLSELAVLIKKHMRTTDILARPDGDEFALLVTETQPSRVEFVIERLLKAVRNHSVDAGSQPVGVTASAGIAFFPEHGATADELVPWIFNPNRTIIHDASASSILSKSV